jgi:hypothetical protein
MTTEPTDSQLDPETEQEIVQALTRLATGYCIQCGALPDRFVQVHRSYYAEPCGHRQGQGKAAYFNGLVAKERERLSTQEASAE